MLFQAGKRLTPSELYYAAIGMFLSKENEYEQAYRVESDTQGIREFARVFKRKSDNKYFVVYYPGKDNEEPQTARQTTLALKRIKNHADNVIGRSLDDFKDAEAIKIFFVCENNPYPAFIRREHYVYMESLGQSFTVYDSKPKFNFLFSYSLNGIMDLFLKNRRGGVTPHSVHSGAQKDDTSCGLFAGETLRWRLDNQFDSQTASKAVFKLKFTNPNLSNMVSSMSESYNFALGNESDQENISKENAEVNPGFFQRHRKTKYALIGLGIGLGLAAAGVALALAWPVVLPAVGSFIAAHIAVGALTTATVGWLGVGAMGAAATLISTAVSFVVKGVRDRVSRKSVTSSRSSFNRADSVVDDFENIEPVEGVGREAAPSISTSTPTTTTTNTSDRVIGDTLRNNDSGGVMPLGSLDSGPSESREPLPSIRVAQPSVAKLGQFAAPIKPEAGDDSDDEIYTNSGARKKIEKPDIS